MLNLWRNILEACVKQQEAHIKPLLSLPPPPGAQKGRKEKEEKTQYDILLEEALI